MKAIMESQRCELMMDQFPGESVRAQVVSSYSRFVQLRHPCRDGAVAWPGTITAEGQVQRNRN